MKSRIRFGLLTAICALGAFTSLAHADDRDRFRERVQERARENAQSNHRGRDHDRRDSHRDYSHERRDYSRDRHDYQRNDYRRNDDRHDYGRRHDYDHRRDYNYRRDYDRRPAVVERRYYKPGYDHRHFDSRRSFSYYDRFDRRFHPALKRGFYCDDFGHYRGRHYHVSRSDFYGAFYPSYPYRPYYDRGGSLSVIVSIPF